MRAKRGRPDPIGNSPCRTGGRPVGAVGATRAIRALPGAAAGWAPGWSPGVAAVLPDAHDYHEYHGSALTHWTARGASSGGASRTRRCPPVPGSGPDPALAAPTRRRGRARIAQLADGGLSDGRQSSCQKAGQPSGRTRGTGSTENKSGVEADGMGLGVCRLVQPQRDGRANDAGNMSVCRIWPKAANVEGVSRERSWQRQRTNSPAT